MSVRSTRSISRQDALEALGLQPHAPLVHALAENTALRQALAALTHALNAEREHRRSGGRPRSVAA